MNKHLIFLLCTVFYTLTGAELAKVDLFQIIENLTEKLDITNVLMLRTQIHYKPESLTVPDLNGLYPIHHLIHLKTDAIGNYIQDFLDKGTPKDLVVEHIIKEEKESHFTIHFHKYTLLDWFLRDLAIDKGNEYLAYAVETLLKNGCTQTTAYPLLSPLNTKKCGELFGSIKDHFYERAYLKIHNLGNFSKMLDVLYTYDQALKAEVDTLIAQNKPLYGTKIWHGKDCFICNESKKQTLCFCLIKVRLSDHPYFKTRLETQK